ncbi:hypothetical protein HYH03_006300 [Edaphochlamys debaryana]|uniref:Sulfatase N-terminal domain-containing protein n=1 Tax=Edaphochlamys debaryana TaxID=47281 RepID=A0A836C0G0_9CHLO|nr:hypothetical protein HYH03_006300 [Edaphochlamys debaryana]|eukprot:KAG2495700.1 hypothetical protein HYH03_006300 [Edaphochlamys debaryana]
MQAAGYKTMLSGKTLNHFSQNLADEAGCLPGWDLLLPLVKAPTAADNAEYKRLAKQNPPQRLRWTYTDCKYIEKIVRPYPDDHLFERAYDFAEDAVAAGHPFFLYIAPLAPHDDPSTPNQYPLVDEKYKNALPGIQGPNYAVPCDRRLGMCPQEPMKGGYTDAHYRARAQAMLSIDAQIDELISKLECMGALDNTYIIYTSDNGFKLGQHNFAQEKWTFFEEDMALPLFIRGPGIPKGVYAATVQASMVDITATITSLAGADATPGYQLDGAPIPFNLIASLNPNPNSPFGTYTGPVWSGKTLPSSQTDTCAHPPRPPPRPPLRPAYPPRKKQKPSKRDEWEDDDEGDDDTFWMSNEKAGFEKRYATLDEVVPISGGGSGSGSPVESQPGRRSLLQAEGHPRSLAESSLPWSNVALMEQWMGAEPWTGNDYRAVRACLPPSAAVAQSERGSSRTGHVCYKYIAYCAIRAAPGKQLVNLMFNLSADPAEIDDLMLRTPRPATLQKLVDRLDAVLTVMSYCWGRTCTDPFSHIHGPDGGVHDLTAALDPKYDSLYGGFSKLGFKRCTKVYAGIGNELPDMRLVPQPQQSPPPRPPRPPAPPLSPPMPMAPKREGPSAPPRPSQPSRPVKRYRIAPKPPKAPRRPGRNGH